MGASSWQQRGNFVKRKSFRGRYFSRQRLTLFISTRVLFDKKIKRTILDSDIFLAIKKLNEQKHLSIVSQNVLSL